MDQSQFNQALSLLRNREREGIRANRRPMAEIEQLIQAAALIGDGRKQGMDDGGILGGFARELIRERDRQQGGVGDRIRGAADVLRNENFGMDEADMKDEAQMIRDRELFGFGDIEEAELAQGDVDAGARARELQANRSRLRQLKKKAAAGQRLNAVERRDMKNIGKDIWKAEQNAKQFDFGLVNRDKIVIYDEEKGRIEVPDPNPDMGVANPVRTPDGRLITPEMRQAEGRRQRLISFVEGMGAKAQEERMFRGELNEREMQERARLAAGRVVDARAPLVSQTPIVGVPADVPRPATPEGVNVYREFVPGVVNNMGVAINPEMIDRSGGGKFPKGSEVIELANERVRPRTIIEKEVPKPTPFVENYFRDGSGKGVEYDIRPQRAVGRRPIGEDASLDDIQSKILGQLRARKARGGAVNDQMRAINDQQAVLDAFEQRHNPQDFHPRFRGDNAQGMRKIARTPNIINLGGIKDKRADMGVQLGNQKVNFDTAVPVRRPDGSVEWFDAKQMEMLGNQEFSKIPQVATPAETLNAPLQAETAKGFIEKNMYESYGAQNFGDEALIANLNEKGSGGGIPQVNITGTLDELEQRVAQKLGIPAKGIRSAASFQAAMDAVVQNEVNAGRSLGRIVDNKRVQTGLAGIDEAMLALDIQGAEQKAIANALGQLEMGRMQNVNLAGKDEFFGGGRFVQPAWDGKTIIPNVDDPATGGDRLQFAKDVAFVNKARAAGNRKGWEFASESLFPFIGLNQADVDADRAAREAFKQQYGRNMPQPAEKHMQVYQGKSPAEVRIIMEGRGRKNRKGKPFANPKSASGISTQEQLEINNIRAMQEGNVLAGLRAQQDVARRRAEPYALGGRIMEGTPVPANLAGQVVQRPGRPQAPGQNPVLRPRPERDVSNRAFPAPPKNMRGISKPGPGDAAMAIRQARQKKKPPSTAMNPNPNVVQAPPIELPSQMREAAPQQEAQAPAPEGRAYNQVQRAVDERLAKRRGGRRIGAAVGGGSAAVLATLLGISNMNNEEEEEVMI